MTGARPKRTKMDRLLNPGATLTEIEVGGTLGPFDRVSDEMEIKWGIDRLHTLVSTDMAQKYAFSLGKLNEFISDGDKDNVAAWAAVCIRGLHAMDREAEASGAPKARGLYREHEVDGFRFGILDDDREWQTAKAARPDLKFYTMRDIGVALKAMEGVAFLDTFREHFPKAQPTKLPNLTELLARGGDDLPQF